MLVTYQLRFDLIDKARRRLARTGKRTIRRVRDPGRQAYRSATPTTGPARNRVATVAIDGEAP